MQKIMVCLERPSEFENEEWSEGISDLLHSHQHDLRAAYFTVEDQHVAQAKNIRLENTPHPKNAIISAWLKNIYSLDHFFADLESLGRYQGYNVVENRNNPFKQRAGRTPGFCQTCLLTKPATQSQQQWLDIWLGAGTKISLETQASYSLTQNITTSVMPIKSEQSDAWVPLGGIVQDYFFDEAMLSRKVFFDAKGDHEKYLENEQRLISSCLRFIDFDHFDCVPMTQYVIKGCDWR